MYTHVSGEEPQHKQISDHAVCMCMQSSRDFPCKEKGFRDLKACTMFDVIAFVKDVWGATTNVSVKVCICTYICMCACMRVCACVHICGMLGGPRSLLY